MLPMYLSSILRDHRQGVQCRRRGMVWNPLTQTDVGARGNRSEAKQTVIPLVDIRIPTLL